MSMTVLNVPEQGQLVRVRSRQWVVNEVKPSTLPSPAMKPSFDGAQNLITLASVEDDGLGEELLVVWEVEPGASVVEKVDLPEPTDFAPLRAHVTRFPPSLCVGVTKSLHSGPSLRPGGDSGNPRRRLGNTAKRVTAAKEQAKMKDGPSLHAPKRARKRAPTIPNETPKRREITHSEGNGMQKR